MKIYRSKAKLFACVTCGRVKNVYLLEGGVCRHCYKPSRPLGERYTRGTAVTVQVFETRQMVARIKKIMREYDLSITAISSALRVPYSRVNRWLRLCSCKDTQVECNAAAVLWLREVLV